MQPKSKFQNEENILVVCLDAAVSHQLRSGLQELNLGKVEGVFSHKVALQKIVEKKYQHIFFDSTSKDMEVSDFVKRVKDISPDSGLIILVEKINIDDAFAFLKSGLQSFLVVPFTFDSVEQSMKYASSDNVIREDLLQDKDYHKTLAEVALTNFNMLCRLKTLLKENPKDGAANLKSLIKDREAEFKKAVELARSVSESAAVFQTVVVDKCLEHATNGSTRLGKVRRALREKRKLEQQTQNSL